MKNKQKQLKIKDKDNYKNELLISKEREIFKNIYNKKLDKIEELPNKFNDDDSRYVTKNSGIETNFSVKTNFIAFLNDIKTNKIAIEEAKASQEYFNKRGKKDDTRRKKNWKTKKTLSNINILPNGRNNAIRFVEDYGSMILG